MDVQEHYRARWFLEFIQEDIGEDNADLRARELAWLSTIVDLTCQEEDDKRVKLALEMARDHPAGSLDNIVEKIRPILSDFQRFLLGEIESLLQGNKMTVELSSLLHLNLDVVTSGGLSEPVIEVKEDARFTLTTGFPKASLITQIQANLMLALVGLPVRLLIKCKECGKYFIAGRKDAESCSKRCRSRSNQRAYRKSVKADPARRDIHDAGERDRAHNRYVMEVRKDTPKAKVARRARKPTTKEVLNGSTNQGKTEGIGRLVGVHRTPGEEEGQEGRKG